MFRLKANKTNLYKLVSTYETMPTMRRVTFAKAHRRPDYWMRWTDAAGLRCDATLFAIGGRGKLLITKTEHGRGEVSSTAYTLDLVDLQERGMVEEFATATERRATDGTV